MAYTQQTWQDGVTPVDAERMNHIEGGVADLSDAVDELQENPVIHTIYEAERDTRSTEFEYTGVSVTIPARSIFVITGIAQWNAVGSRAVGFADSDTNWTAARALAYAEAPVDGQGNARCILGGRVSSQTTYYLWGSWGNSTTSNEARIEGFYFNYE